jgi:hypothetical protein
MQSNSRQAYARRTQRFNLAVIVAALIGLAVTIIISGQFLQ